MTVEEAAAEIRELEAVRPRGGGTKLAWSPMGSTSPVDFDTRRFNRILEHNEGEAERAEELSGKILDACLDAGGSITGEHGVGVDKKKHMPKMFGEADLDAFQRLRCAFDPAGLANPGKVMPTPRLCGEVPGPYRQHPLEAAGLAERF